MTFSKKAWRLVLATLVAYAALVATHEGEFWPFSIYPMFSQAGKPWSRALVRELPSPSPVLSWAPVSLGELAGEPFPMQRSGVNQNDLANFIAKSAQWDAARLQALRRLFGPSIEARAVLIYRAEGRLDGDSVRVLFTPVVALAPDTALVHPSFSAAPH